MNSEDLVASILNLSNLAKEKLKELEVVVNVDPSKKKTIDVTDYLAENYEQLAPAFIKKIETDKYVFTFHTTIDKNNFLANIPPLIKLFIQDIFTYKCYISDLKYYSKFKENVEKQFNVKVVNLATINKGRTINGFEFSTNKEIGAKSELNLDMKKFKIYFNRKNDSKNKDVKENEETKLKDTSMKEMPINQGMNKRPNQKRKTRNIWKQASKVTEEIPGVKQIPEQKILEQQVPEKQSHEQILDLLYVNQQEIENIDNQELENKKYTNKQTLKITDSQLSEEKSKQTYADVVANGSPTATEEKPIKETTKINSKETKINAMKSLAPPTPPKSRSLNISNVKSY